MHRNSNEATRQKTVTGRSRSFFHITATNVMWTVGAAGLIVTTSAMAVLRQDTKSPAATQTKIDVNETSDSSQPAVKTETHKTSIQSSTRSSVSSSDETAASTPRQSARLKVDGRSVPLPSNGTVHKEIHTSGGKTTVDFSANSNKSGSSESDTTMNIEVHSDTESTVDRSE